jgi:hypothetical protein
MGSPLEICRRRGVVAVLASGVVISLTALTGGVAPAFAKPDEEPVVPTTIVVPEPEAQAPEPEKPARGPEEPVAVPEYVAPEPPAPVEAPAPKVEAPAPKVEAPRQTQAPAPQTQEPVTEVVEPVAPAPKVVEPVEPETQEPQAPARPPVTSVEPAAPSEPSTAQRAPKTAEAPSTATEAPDAPAQAPEAADETASESPQTPGTLVPPSEALAPDSEARKAPESGDTETPDSESASDPGSAAEETSSDDPATSEVSQAAKVIETAEPQTLQAEKQDIELAKAAKPIEEKVPAPAAENDVAAFSNSINLSLGRNGINAGANTDFRFRDRDGDRDWDWARKVRQWRPEWVEYDRFYRPIFLNPFRAPVRIVYIYDFRPRILYIPPLARIVLDVARYAAYSFTAMILNPINAAVDLAQDVVATAANIAIGSFFGGGYVPRAGLPLPPPPPPVLRYDNVPVLVRYAQRTYEPFRVRRIVDVGDDRQYGGRKVLLDGVTPAWGQWTQTANGERQFEVHKTQQFPCLDTPQEGPLPGDYPLRLASDETSTGGFTGRDVFLFVAAGVIGTLGFGAIGMAFFLGRRRPEH